MITHVTQNTCDVIIKRLGKKSDDSNNAVCKPRPMLIKFLSGLSKSEFMKNLKRLKSAPEKFRKIYVKHDETPIEREATRNLLKEAAKQNSENLSKNEIYVVRGPPWSKKIVKIKKKIQ